MSAPHFKLQTLAQEQTAAQEQTVRQFDTPEELLRLDAAQTPVPPAVAARLQESVEKEDISPPSVWWRKLLGQ